MSVVYLPVRSEGGGGVGGGERAQMSFHLPVVGLVSGECMILEAKRSSFHIIYIYIYIKFWGSYKKLKCNVCFFH